MSPNGIKQWPRSERPRELLLEMGPDSVSDAGLIAILLGSGIPGKDAVSLARELLIRFEGLSGLLHASHHELKKTKGLGLAKIAILSTIKEIINRHAHQEIAQKGKIQSSEDVAPYLFPVMKGLKKEVFKVVFLDQANRILAIEDLSEGTIDQSQIYPREVFKRAFELGATGLIFAHNHPSGQLEPSRHDIEFTKKLYLACEAVEIRALDHLIFAGDDFYSINKYIV